MLNGAPQNKLRGKSSRLRRGVRTGVGLSLIVEQVSSTQSPVLC